MWGVHKASGLSEGSPGVRQAAARGFRLRLGLLTLGGFVCILAGGVETTVLPLFVSRQIHGSTLDVGIVVGTLTFSSMLSRPLVAPMMRIAGSTVTVLATSFVTAAVLAAYPWVHSVPVLAVLRAAGGIGDAGFLVSGIAVACAVVPEGREGEATSFFTSANSLSLVGGALISGWLLTLGGYRAAWYAAASLAVAGGSITAAASRGGRPVSVMPLARRRLLHPAAVRPGAAMALGVLPVGGFFALAPLYAGREGISPGAVMSLYGGVIVVARTLGSSIPDRLGGHRGTALAFASTAAGAAIIGIVPPPAGLLVGTAAFALGIALCMPASMKLALASAGSTERVAVIGTMTAFFSAAQTAGAPLLGLIADAGSIRLAFAAGACTPAAALLLHAKSKKPGRSA